MYYPNSATCYLKILSPDSAGSIILADAVKKIYLLNKRLQIKDSIKTDGPIVDVDFNKNDMLAYDIGILNPNNGKYGKADIISNNLEGEMYKIRFLYLNIYKDPYR